MSFSYTPTTWVEKVTPVGPTNLNKLEHGVRDAYTQANGTFNAKDAAYGAVGDGATDDTVAIQAAITACITAGGGTVFLPAGTYKITATLDFSALAGKLQTLTFAGAGSGGYILSSAGKGATIIKNTAAGTALKAQATNSGSAISGLYFRGFTINNTVDLGAATTFSIYWDGVYSQAGMKDVVVVGSGSALAAAGSGIAVNNCFNGQTKLDRVIVYNFNGAGSVGIKVAAPATTPFPSGINSGNLKLENCNVIDCPTGFNVAGVNGLLNSVHLDTCKAVGQSVIPAGTGFQIGGGGSTQNIVITAPHVENYGSAFVFSGANWCSLISPIVSYGATPPASSANITFGSPSYGNEVHSAQFGPLQYGVTFQAGTSGNYVSGRANQSSGPTVKTFNDGGSNYWWNMADSVPPGADISYNEFTAPVSITATTEATATTIVTALATTFDGGTQVDIEFFSYDATTAANAAGNALVFVLYQDGSSIGFWAQYATGGTTFLDGPVRLSRRLTPTSGSHTYSVRAYRSNANCTVGAGAGGAAAAVPGYIRLRRA